MSIVANKNIVVCGTIYGGIDIALNFISTELQMNIHVEMG